MSYLQHAVRLARHSVRAQAKRSHHWWAVEKEHLAKHPTCLACGSWVGCQVHHVIPFHLNPALELEPTNLVTLCMRKDRHCHLLVGHGDDFKAYAPNVRSLSGRAVLAQRDGMDEVIKAIHAEARASRRYEIRSE